MLARPVKCPVCNEFGDREGMVLDGKRYYHPGSCLETYKKQQEKTNKENEQWDKLYQYIVSLHDLLLLPKPNILRLKDLRAGFEVKDGKRIRKYRTGPDYELMLDAYRLAEDSIKWCIANTLKGSNDIGAINYCMSIMINKLNEAYARRKSRMRQEESLKELKDTNVVEEREFVYKKKKQEDDNSFLFQ